MLRQVGLRSRTRIPLHNRLNFRLGQSFDFSLLHEDREHYHRHNLRATRIPRTASALNMDDLGVFRPPAPDYFCKNPSHRWEAEKFEMDLDDIFTTLPRRFNMMVIPILDRDAFRLETSHIASVTNDRKEFFDQLEVRLEDRRKELISMMQLTFEKLAHNPDQIEDATRWYHAMCIYNSKSLDAFVRFFAGLLRSPRPLADTAVSASNRHDESLTPRSEISSSRESGTSADAKTVPRKRKRPCSTPDSLGLVEEQDDEDAIRPARKARLDKGALERRRTRSSTSSRRPSSQRVGRARQSQLPLPPPSSPSEVLSTTTIAPTASPGPPRPQHAARGANGQDPSGQRDNMGSSQAASVGKGGQRVRSFSAVPDTKERDMEAGHSAHDASNTKARQCGGPHSPPAKRPARRPARRPTTEAHTRLPQTVQSNAKKPAPRNVPGPTARTLQGTPIGMDQTRPLRRRRTRLGEQALYELDHKNRARTVVAGTPRRGGQTAGQPPSQVRSG